MDKAVIEISNLSKKYQLGRKKCDTLRDEISKKASDLSDFFRKQNENQLQKNEFWALRDINLSVYPGEILGVIGKNGSGKSTLLKILSRITYPTLGKVRVRGHVASLLEIGTGFSMELTGRENIFLNGAILGMKRTEIKRKLDEIIAFSGVEKFIDTPVKHYSSGMYVRLAFAVAAHLETDILFVDEVLSVGDIEFQKKSLNRMEKITKEGRTIIFVSHNLEAVGRLCKRILYLNKGKVGAISNNVPMVIARFLKDSSILVDPVFVNKKIRQRNHFLAFASIKIINSSGKISDTITEGETFKIKIEMTVMENNLPILISLTFIDETGRDIATNFSNKLNEYLSFKKGRNTLEAIIDTNIFAPGIFGIRLTAFGVDTKQYDKIIFSNVLRIAPIPGSGAFFNQSTGFVNLDIKWKK